MLRTGNPGFIVLIAQLVDLQNEILHTNASQTASGSAPIPGLIWQSLCIRSHLGEPPSIPLPTRPYMVKPRYQASPPAPTRPHLAKLPYQASLSRTSPPAPTKPHLAKLRTRPH